MSKTSQSQWSALQRFMREKSQKLTLGKLDQNNLALLNWIVGRHDPTRPLHVQEIVMHSGVMSPAWTYRGIQILDEAGLITIVTDKVDARRRIISPSEKALRELKELDRVLLLWIKGCAVK